MEQSRARPVIRKSLIYCTLHNVNSYPSTLYRSRPEPQAELEDLNHTPVLKALWKILWKILEKGVTKWKIIFTFVPCSVKVRAVPSWGSSVN